MIHRTNYPQYLWVSDPLSIINPWYPLCVAFHLYSFIQQYHQDIACHTTLCRNGFPLEATNKFSSFVIFLRCFCFFVAFSSCWVPDRRWSLNVEYIMNGSCLLFPLNMEQLLLRASYMNLQCTIWWQGLYEPRSI